MRNRRAKAVPTRGAKENPSKTSPPASQPILPVSAARREGWSSKGSPSRLALARPWLDDFAYTFIQTESEAETQVFPSPDSAGGAHEGSACRETCWPLAALS